MVPAQQRQRNPIAQSLLCTSLNVFTTSLTIHTCHEIVIRCLLDSSSHKAGSAGTSGKLPSRAATTSIFGLSAFADLKQTRRSLRAALATTNQF